MKRLIIFSLLVLLAGCEGRPDYKIRELPSGKSIKVSSVKHSVPVGGTPILVLQYETDFDVDDQESLRQEVYEVWYDFKAYVQEKGYSRGRVVATNTRNSFFVFTSYDQHSYLFTRTDYGYWTMDDGAGAKKLPLTRGKACTDTSKNYPTNVNLVFEKVSLINSLQLLAMFSCNEIKVGTYPDVMISPDYEDVPWDKVTEDICNKNKLECWVDNETMYVTQTIKEQRVIK